MRYSNTMRSIILIAHNLRSTHNVGSLLRTAEGLGAHRVLLTGYTPYPLQHPDNRLPHLAAKIDRAIQKTALGADTILEWQHHAELLPILEKLKQDDYIIAAVEQSRHSIRLPDYRPPSKLALIVGREVEGIEQEILDQADVTLEIPMFGNKESFNVVQSAAMAMYHCRFEQEDVV